MSETTNLSIVVLMGDVRKKMSNFIGEACNNLYQVDTDYLATQEREIALKELYIKNFVGLEQEHIVQAVESDKILSNDHVSKSQLQAIHVISMAESIAQVEPMAFVTKKKYGSKLKKVHSLVKKIKSHLQDNIYDSDAVQKLTTDCEPILRKIAKDTHSLLANAEDKISLETVTATMNGLDYKVKTNGKNLIGSKGNISVRARAEGGRLMLDTTTFPGISCHREVHRIEAELERRGFILRRAYENTMKLNEGYVKLKDPFPPFPVANLKRDRIRQKHSDKNKKTNKSLNNYQTNKHINLLLQGHMLQMDQNVIREKTI